MKEEKQMPRVSIVVTTYNWPRALELSVRSIFRQSVLPCDILVADDGSGEETRELVDRLREESPVPLVHVWHEDKGFRLSVIRNKAIARASGDYIIQIDGDVILPRHFVSDHLDLAEQGHFVCGSRVKLPEKATERILSGDISSLRIWDVSMGFVIKSLRSRALRHFLAFRYAKTIDHLRGCNMAFWRSDAIKVNGYNEDLLQWGHEDGEFAFRLHFAGVAKKALKMGGCVYHLNHKIASRDNEQRHLDELEAVKRERRKWCENGIDKYL